MHLLYNNKESLIYLVLIQYVFVLMHVYKISHELIINGREAIIKTPLSRYMGIRLMNDLNQRMNKLPIT
ncbi:hypothetical protein [Vulcanisaeta souniana]|uniref:Uncharacterized protein n=1 Tax=Vulcanisaeta souniana JCM 11219 TaxID=1293586 RepID=A0A830E1G1_9CREN|nr:hypothetical protein [Vulcanisaeta souniana]BDR91422.1 hypothetical protein Vsou_05150 [Vulcanisaeta souniana JCM 11219]GGI73016.1 hypothetical protein GCM10007112_07360 [Vulcanisaeta souniana JCM 11219]